MLRHSFILIYRNFKRFRSTFFINLIGLSTGLACTLLIYLWVNDELNVDKFNEKDSQLFQVMEHQQNDANIIMQPGTPKHLANLLLEEMPEIEYAATVTPPAWFPKFTLVAQQNPNPLKAVGKFASSDYFKVFSYNLIQGNENQVLTDKNSIIISETLAKNLFNTAENIVGKTIEWQMAGLKQQCQITGVFKNVPANASEQFDFVLSFESLQDIIGRAVSWDNVFNTYVVLKKEVNVDQLNNKMGGFIKEKNAGSNVTLFLKPYSENYLYGKYENGVQAGGRIEYVRLFSIIALFILVIACINFMNLSTAKAAGRIKEVGIKKAVGARRSTLVLQYLGESLCLSFIALLVAIAIVKLLLPAFNDITDKQLYLQPTLNLIIAALSITLFTGIVAGSYPALYLSGFNPVTILKGKLNTSVGELWARKGLVVFQFTLSVIFIISVLIIYRQIEFVQHKNLGYDKDNLLYFETEGKVATNPEPFLAELRKLPGVQAASSMGGSIIISSLGNIPPEVNFQGKKIAFRNSGINYDMIETLGIEMVAGRSFSRNFSADTTKLIFNQKAIEVMGLQEPVVGKMIQLDQTKVEILGVVKDFHLESLHEPVKPFFFRFDRLYAATVMVRITAGAEKKTIQTLQQFYKNYNPGFVFDYKFLDQDYQAQYAAENRVSILSRYFAALAVLISCLGLFGLAAFTAERRSKEIGIRKVLGASVLNIVRLISTDFLQLVGIAILLAIPAAWYLMHNWLATFAYHINIQGWIFMLAGVAAICVALLTVGFQAIRAAVANPVESLRSE